MLVTRPDALQFLAPITQWGPSHDQATGTAAHEAAVAIYSVTGRPVEPHHTPGGARRSPVGERGAKAGGHGPPFHKATRDGRDGRDI